jgi:hypothetical protein
MGWRGFGFVHPSRTIFCRAVPNPYLTIRNFFIAVARAWRARRTSRCPRRTPAPGSRRTAAQRRNRLRIVTVGVSGVGDELTRPFRDARRFPSTRGYPVPGATRATSGFEICPSFKGHSLSPRAKRCRYDSQLIHRCTAAGGVLDGCQQHAPPPQGIPNSEHFPLRAATGGPSCSRMGVCVCARDRRPTLGVWSFLPLVGFFTVRLGSCGTAGTGVEPGVGYKFHSIEPVLLGRCASVHDPSYNTFNSI